jgi:hypothetical protein
MQKGIANPCPISGLASAAPILLANALFSTALAQEPRWRAFRDIYQGLVEINTTDSAYGARGQRYGGALEWDLSGVYLAICSKRS